MLSPIQQDTLLRWALVLETAGQHDLAQEYRRLAEQSERRAA